MADNFDLNDIKRRMQGAIASFKHDLNSLRTGRASANLLDPIEVEAYGARMPIAQVATVSVPEPRLLSVQVWDRGMVHAVEKAIRDSSLGLNPNTEGQVIRLRIPELNEQRRKELTKVAAAYAEHARVAIRNLRRDGMDQIKKAKAKHLSEDDAKFWEGEVQEMTDKYIKLIDQTLETKQHEIMQV